MPSSELIVRTLTATANDWRPLAIGWHLSAGLFLVALARGWRPSARLAGWVLVAPLASVGALAWWAGNPFNGATFALLAIVLTMAAARFGQRRVSVAPPIFAAAGLLLIAFGWAYPHFVRVDRWTEDIYAPPMGLVPCPTLAAVMGATLLLNLSGWNAWTAVLAAAGIFYGAIGVIKLDVALDYGLLAGAAALAAQVVWRSDGRRSVRANRDERTRPLPGDDFIPAPIGMFTHAITIRRPPARVWPWLAQMGAGSRAGWYSYDTIDNGGRPSASRILPGLQHPEVGTIFPALPGATDGFTLLAIDPERVLTLGWLGPDAKPVTTWAFVLTETVGGATRLVTRVRARNGYRFFGLPWWAARPVVRLVHFVMERRQLTRIARRVERDVDRAAPDGRPLAGREAA